MLRLIVFDWDGTLADSVSKIVEGKHFLADKYALPRPTEVVIRNVLGTKFEEAMQVCFPSASRTVLNRMCEEFHDLMKQDKYRAPLFPNAKAALEKLKWSKFTLAIATSKERNELEVAINQNRLSPLFDMTCCGAEYQAKPDPAMLKHIMTSFGVSPDECLMIGDTTTDILFAANAGVQTVCVTFGAYPRDKLQAMNPCAFIDDLAQLPQVVDEIARI